MEKIGFPEVEKLYNVVSIDTVSNNLLKIVFPDKDNRPDNDLLTDKIGRASCRERVFGLV